MSGNEHVIEVKGLGERELWVADSETDPFKRGRIPKPFLWGCYNGREIFQFDTTAEFIAFWVDRGPCLIYARNGGKFDWHYLLPSLGEFSKVMVINGRLAKLSIGEAEFRDSLNITPFAMAEYKKEKIDYSIFEEGVRDKLENRHKIREYHISDLKTEWEIVAQFLQEYGLHLTFSGAAMAYWSKLSKQKVPRATASYHHTFKPYYYGGRVQALRIGEIEGPIYSADIVSAYPAAACKPHPWGFGYEESKKLPTEKETLLRSFLTIRGPSCGALPFRDEKTGGLTFPNDGEEREFFITGHEYVAARETGAMPWYTLKNCLTHSLTITFEEYVEHFFAKKKAAKEIGSRAGYLFSKFMMNGLTGKFGASPDDYEEYLIVHPKFIEKCEEVDGYTFNGLVGPWALMSRPLPETQQHFYNVATVASITGMVRAQLWRALCETSGTIYCDTDNVKWTGKSAIKLGAGTLGSWELEGTYARGFVAGKKLYAMQTEGGAWTTASKGVRLTPTEIQKIATGDMVEYFPDIPTYSLSRGTAFATGEAVQKSFTNRKIRIK